MEVKVEVNSLRSRELKRNNTKIYYLASKAIVQHVVLLRLRLSTNWSARTPSQQRWLNSLFNSIL